MFFFLDSGLPTFRDKEGFWRAYPPARKAGLDFSQVSDPRTFYENERLAWGFFGHRYHLYSKAPPHNGYQILLELSRTKKDYFVFTSNVDGAFEKAGFSPLKIIECHGSIHYLQARDPKQTWTIVPAIETSLPNLRVDDSTFEAQGVLPFLLNSQGIKIPARPNILMFDDHEFLSERLDEQKLRWETFINRISQDANVAIVEIGAGSAIPTVRYTSERLLSRFTKANLIRINIDEAEGPARTISIPLGGRSALESMLEARI